jgi:peptide/nickel transport system permease protein
MSGTVDGAAELERSLGYVRREHEIARSETLDQLLHCRTFLAGIGIVGFWVLAFAAGKAIGPNWRYVADGPVLAPPSLHHVFGTDALGRDVFERVLFGAGGTLAVAPLATLIGLTLGTLIGLTTGFFAGSTVDDVVGRGLDAMLSLPFLVLAVLVIAATGDESDGSQAIVIGLAFTPAVARTIRAAVLHERELEYVDSARLQGESRTAIVTREILPNITGTILVEGTVRFGYAIFATAGLRFLGFGPQPPSPDWALQVRDNYVLMLSGSYWWTVLFASLAICTLVVGVHLIADGLQQVLDV